MRGEMTDVVPVESAVTENCISSPVLAFVSGWQRYTFGSVNTSPYSMVFEADQVIVQVSPDPPPSVMVASAAVAAVTSAPTV